MIGTVNRSDLNEHVLTEPALADYAGETIFARGEDYVRYVHGLRVNGSIAEASVQARRIYLVRLDWSGPGLTGSCTCPHNAQGNFCKHLVAVGLAVLADTAGRAGARDATTHEPAALNTWLDGLDVPELRQIILDLIARDQSVERLLTIRATSAATADPSEIEGAAAELVTMVNATLRTRGFVDYRRSFDIAQDAEKMLDELEQFLESGTADVTLAALKRATMRLRTITLHADDSGGVIGGAGQRAVDLYACACREGHPSATKLAHWLVKFRAESPGWPNVRLGDFVGAFDKRALDAYRKDVSALETELAEVDHFRRYELDLMLLELADHDDDLDRAIQILSTEDHVQYGAIVERLRAAGRQNEMYEWIDRAAAAGNITEYPGPNDYFLEPTLVAEDYLRRDRGDDAIAVLRRALTDSVHRGRPVEAAHNLFAFADRVGLADTERQWVDDELRRLAREPFGSGAALVELAIADHDLDAAWAAADEYGAGHAWESLALASVDSHPAQAADLREPLVAESLKITESKRYPGIADELVRIRDLRRRAGQEDQFNDLIREIRSTYGRRPSLMTALERRGL